MFAMQRVLLLLSMFAAPSQPVAAVRATDAELTADFWDSSVCGGGWPQYAAMHRDVLAGARPGASILACPQCDALHGENNIQLLLDIILIMVPCMERSALLALPCFLAAPRR
jgi:hypothetical protein